MRGHSHGRRGARPGRLLRRARRATGAAWTGLVRLDPEALRAAGLEPVPVGPDAWVPALAALRDDALLISTTRAGSDWPGLRVPVEAVDELTTGSPLSERGGLTLRLGTSWVHLPLVAGDGGLEPVVDRLPRWAARLPRPTAPVRAADLLDRHAADRHALARHLPAGEGGPRRARHATPFDVRDHRRRLTRCAATVLAGLLLLAAYLVSGPLLATPSDRLRASGVRTTGTVTVLYPDSPRSPGRIEVTFPLDSPRFRATVDLGAQVARFRAGQAVRTWYDRDDPSRIAVEDVGARAAWSVLPARLAAVLGLVAVVGGLAVGAVGVVRFRRHRAGGPAPTMAPAQPRPEVEVEV